MKILKIFTLFFSIIQIAFQLDDALQLNQNQVDVIEWFNLQISTPYVRKFIFNDDIKQQLKDNNQIAMNVLEAQFVVQENDPKANLIISVIGSSFSNSSPFIYWYDDLESEMTPCGKGSALCFVNQEVLSLKKIIYLRVQCRDSCEFEVFLQYQLSNDIIPAGETNTTLMDKEYIKISKLMIEYDSKKVKGFQIEVSNKSQKLNGFDIYLFKDQEFNSTLNAISSPLTTKDYGKIIRFDFDKNTQDSSDFTLVLRSAAKQKFLIVVNFIYIENPLPIKINIPVHYVLRPSESIILKGSNDQGQLPWKQQAYICINIDVHQGTGMLYIDNKINKDDQQNRINQSFSYSQSICLEKYFFEKQAEKVPTFYIKISADEDVSFTILYQLKSLTKNQSINVATEKYLSISSKTQNYIVYDLGYELSAQQEVIVAVQDLLYYQQMNNNFNNRNLKSNIKMLVKNCAESIKNLQDCKFTADEINSQSKLTTTSSSIFIPIIKVDNGGTQHSTLDQFQQTNRTDSQYFRFLIAIISSEDGLANIVKFTSSIQRIQESISPFKEYTGQLSNTQKKFLQFQYKIPPLQITSEVKRITIYVQTEYGSVNIESAQENPLTNSFIASKGKTQQVSAYSTLAGEAYITYDIELDPSQGTDQEKDIYITLTAQSDAIYSVYIYVQNASKNILGNLRAIGKNLDLGRVNDDKLCDVSTMNTLNLYLPYNTTYIFIYFYIDYSVINFEKVKTDITQMTLNSDKKKKVQVTPYIKLTDLQTGIEVNSTEYNSTQINDGLLYVQTNNKENQYYQLDIMNNYSSNYNISIDYSLLYTQNNYYFLKSGFKYQISLDEQTKSKIVFFYAKQNSNVFFQIFTCNGTFSFQQWFQKPTKEQSQLSFTIESYKDINLYVEQSGFYYFQFNLNDPHTQGEIIFNLHIYDSNYFSPYDLISAPKAQYDIQQTNDQMKINFNYLNLNNKVIQQLDEQIFQPTQYILSDSQQDQQQPIQSEQQKQYELDVVNTKALKNILKDISTIKILYFTQLSTSNKLVSYCNPCFLKQRSYEQFYQIDKKSFNASYEEINSIVYDKRDLFNQIQKRSPQDLIDLTETQPDRQLDANNTLNTTLYFNILAILETKDNIGQLTEQYYFVYDTQEINLTYKNITQLQPKEQIAQVVQSQQYTIIICVIVFAILLLIALICSYRMFRKDMKLPCSCFMQQVYSDIPDSENSEKRVKKISKNKVTDINVKVRDSIQEFLNVQNRKRRLSNSPPPPTLND